MRTEDTLEALEAALLANCGDLFDACKQARVSPGFVAKWRADDPLVNERLTSAADLGALQLESEAIRRATKGVDKGVYYKGQWICDEKQYSDTLLVHLMKGRLKGTYGGDAQVGTFNLTQNIAIVPRANSYEEWLEMARITEQKQLVAPDATIEDAEFSTVLPPPELDPAMADIL